MLQVLPTEYGQRLPLYFPFQPSYWRGAKPAAGAGLHDSSFVHAPAVLGDIGPAVSGKSEPAVAIRGLCKDFATTDGCLKRALDGLTLDVQAGQVTALLGARMHARLIRHPARLHAPLALGCFCLPQAQQRQQ